MQILGIGLDAIEIQRVAESYERFGDRFLHRVFTPGEIAYATRRRNPVPHLAGRFAAKEATMKALGTGWARGVHWRDIEVTRQPGRPPQLALSGGAARRFEALGATQALLTITHSETMALAHVMLV